MTLFPCICTDYFVFFIPDYQFQKALMIFLFQIISLKGIFVSLGNNFCLFFFVEAP